MTDNSTDLPELESAIQDVFRGSLEEFVQRRDTLAKQLRANKKPEDAEKVKALRKPSRAAWALDCAVHDDAGSVERLAAALSAAQEAQSRGGGDLRSALEKVRTATRAVAEAAARATAGAHPMEAASLVAAVTAVIGDANAFEALRAGRLADIPEAGGLDFLTAVAPAVRTSPAAAAGRTPQETKESKRAAAARAELERAEAALSEARERSKTAQRALQEAEAKWAAAERQLERARDEATLRRADVERARSDANVAAAQEREAERAVGRMRLRIE